MKKMNPEIKEIEEKIQINEFDLEKFNKIGSRNIIFGASNSGKTFLLQKRIYPKIFKTYEYVFIITQITNNGGYISMIPNNYFMYEKGPYGTGITKKMPQVEICNPVGVKDIENELTKITKFQEANMLRDSHGNVMKDDEGNIKYKYNVLLIFDDILSKKLKESDKFSNIFTNFRHWHVTLIFLIQSIYSFIDSLMISNTTYLTIYDLSGQRTAIISRFITPVVNKYLGRLKLQKKIERYPSAAVVKEIANDIYNKYLLSSNSALVFDMEKVELYRITPLSIEEVEKLKKKKNTQ